MNQTSSHQIVTAATVSRGTVLLDGSTILATSTAGTKFTVTLRNSRGRTFTQTWKTTDDVAVKA